MRELGGRREGRSVVGEGKEERAGMKVRWWEKER